MRSKTRAMWAACAVAFGAAAGCGDDGGPQGFGVGGCASNEQICRLPEGSTQMDVQRALGNAQSYTERSSTYFCQQIVGQQIVHNDVISFEFDSAGRLTDVSGIRMGAAATPLPDWPSCTMSASANGAGGSSGGGACASIPLPAPDSTVCQAVVFGSAPVMMNCTDQKGNKWSSICGGGTCGCSYNDVMVCNCTPPTSGGDCCPGT